MLVAYPSVLLQLIASHLKKSPYIFSFEQLIFYLIMILLTLMPHAEHVCVVDKFFYCYTHLPYMVCLECEQGDVLFLNDGDQHLHLQPMEQEEVVHLHLCAKEFR
jgi:hypothetical protein